jgi:hypothetical protein
LRADEVQEEAGAEGRNPKKEAIMSITDDEDEAVE